MGIEKYKYITYSVADNTWKELDGTGFDSLRRVHVQAPWGGTKGMDPESNTL
jgi:hypothetical protein